MFKQLVLVCVFAAFLASCSKSEDAEFAPVRDRAEQYIADSTSIRTFLDSNYLTVDSEFNTTFQAIEPGGKQESVSKQKDYPLYSKTVAVDGVTYKIYYLKIREGVKNNPTTYDSLLVSYNGSLLNKARFNLKAIPEWVAPSNTPTLQSMFSMKASKLILPEFKGGYYNKKIDSEGEIIDDGSLEFSEFGVGVVFVPSGLGFYQNSQTDVPSYSPFIFSFKLYGVHEIDNDLDGVLTKDEKKKVAEEYDSNLDKDALWNLLDSDKDGLVDYKDTDGDGNLNFLDNDDDGDGVLTKLEYDLDYYQNYDYIKNILVFDTDADGIVNYLDSDDDNDGVLTIYEDLNNNKNWSDDDTNGNGIPNYLDKSDMISTKK